MRICWPRSFGWTGPITAGSLDSEIAEHVKVAAREGVVTETGSPSPPDCQPEDRQH
jgi:hypothetical protein